MPFLPPHPDQHGLAPYNRPGPAPFGRPGPGGQGGNLRQPPFQPHVPPPPPSSPNTAASVLWALAPLFTCGAATPFTMGYAAAKLRSVMLGVSAAIYALGMVVFTLLVVAPGDPGAVEQLLAMVGFTGSWLGGTIHSLIIRGKVFDKQETPNDYAVALAQHRRELRQQARELAERDPALARELRIGRPDLPRQYDDGGLVDINHAPAEVIATLPGMTAALAQRIVEARAGSGFVSAEEVSLALDLSPQLTTELVELTIYLP